MHVGVQQTVSHVSSMKSAKHSTCARDERIPRSHFMLDWPCIHSALHCPLFALRLVYTVYGFVLLIESNKRYDNKLSIWQSAVQFPLNDEVQVNNDFSAR